MTGFVALGLFDGALGVAWPSMRGTFDRRLGELGVLLATYCFGYFVASVTGGGVIGRIGTGRSLIGVATIALAGLAVFVTAPTWPVLLVGSIIVGASGGLVDVTLNAEVAQHHGVRALGFMHAAWGLGSVIGPALATAAVATDRSWRIAYVPVLCVQAGLLVFYVLWRERWAASVPVAAADDDGELDAPMDRVALVLALGLFLVYVGCEAGVGAWSFTLLRDGRGMSDGVAGAWVSAYWASLTAGRVLLGIVGGRWPEARILHGAMALGVVAGAVLALDPFDAGVVALVPLGLAFSVVFPALVALTPARLGPSRTARVLGYQLGASSLGGVLLPGAMGIGAEVWGVDALAPMVLTLTVALAVLHVAAARR
jgi:fucose permease